MKKHGNHNHKDVKETVLGIDFDTTSSHIISEAFGVPGQVAEDIAIAFFKFIKMQFAMEDLYPDLPVSTKTSSMADFLKSDPFKKIGWTPKTPAHYFMLGITIGVAMTREREAMTGDVPEGVVGAGRIRVNSNEAKELVELLKKLSKKRRQ